VKVINQYLISLAGGSTNEHADEYDERKTAQSNAFVDTAV